MWDTSQLRDFVNTMIEAIVSLGGISFAIVLFTFSVYSQRLEEYNKNKELMPPEERIRRYLQLAIYRSALISTTLSVLILLLGPLVVILLYHRGTLNPNLTGASLIGTYSLGMLLLITSVRLFLVGKPEV